MSNESVLETKWFVIDYCTEGQKIEVKIKEDTVKKEFSEIRAIFEADLQASDEERSFRIVAGKYGNAISSLKRSIMRELVIVVTGLFLHYFEIDSTYATAKEIIRALFGLSVKREVILSSFSTEGRSANRKSRWFSLEREEKQLLFYSFNHVMVADRLYESIKTRLDVLVSATRR